MSGADLAVLRPALAALGRTPTPADVAAVMRNHGMVISDEALVSVLEGLRRESIGAGVLDPLLRIDGVTDVLVNGPDEVYLERGQGLERTDVRFGSDEEVRRLAVRLAASVGRRLDEGSPYVDARLADGTRIHAMLATLAAPGTCLSLRVPSRRRLSLDDWVAGGAISRQGAQLLARLVRSRVAFLVCGGTGSGKTTLLATLLGLVPAHERLVIVEDSRELNPCHPHCVRLEARPPNAEGAGAITLTDLVRQALRMRPDRLVLGEVRGAELCDMLNAMNTGHEGGCGTVHANSAADVPARLEALAALGGLGRAAVGAQAGAAIQAIIEVRRDHGERGQGTRRVAGIEVVELRDGLLTTVPAVTCRRDGGLESGPGMATLHRMCR